jgi:hypothetical protein
MFDVQREHVLPPRQHCEVAYCTLVVVFAVLTTHHASAILNRICIIPQADSLSFSNHAVMLDGIPKPNAVKMLQSLLIVVLEPLLHASSNRSQVTIHLAWVLAQDQADNSLPCYVNVLEPTQDVDLRVC